MEYRTIKFKGCTVALNSSKQDDKWACSYFIDTQVKVYRDSADGTFASQKEAEDAAIKKAKKWIDETVFLY